MSAKLLREAAAQIRNDRGGVVSRHTQDGRRWLPVADWLEAEANEWGDHPHMLNPHAERVARAYLGRDE